MVALDWRGKSLFLDEVLVKEIERLQTIVSRLVSELAYGLTIHEI